MGSPSQSPYPFLGSKGTGMHRQSDRQIYQNKYTRNRRKKITFTHICVEVNLSNGLPGSIKLKHKDRS